MGLVEGLIQAASGEAEPPAPLEPSDQERVEPVEAVVEAHRLGGGRYAVELERTQRSLFERDSSGIQETDRPGHGEQHLQLRVPHGQPAPPHRALPVGQQVQQPCIDRQPAADPGFGRILGLVNVSALKRRIKLDFSDFSNEGFVFDVMNGTLNLADGVASTDNLTIKAPSADIFISGEIDLGTRKVNQMIRVVPDPDKQHGFYDAFGIDNIPFASLV